MKLLLTLIFSTCFLACSPDTQFSSDPLVNARPYLSAAPDNYDGSVSLPLIITLHGSGESGLTQGEVSGLEDLVNEKQFILVAPDGLEIASELTGWYFSCCDENLQGEDDVTYLRAVIADVSRRYNVDAQRIYITGHSNGGFMAYQMACQASDLIAAIAVHAGTFKEGEELECNPTHPVAILHAHGTADINVIPEGGSFNFGQGPVSYISAEETLSRWREINACSDSSTEEEFDADSSVSGEETIVHAFADCTSGKDVLYWEMVGSTHDQMYTEAFAENTVDFLFRFHQP